MATPALAAAYRMMSSRFVLLACRRRRRLLSGAFAQARSHSTGAHGSDATGGTPGRDESKTHPDGPKAAGPAPLQPQYSAKRGLGVLHEDEELDLKELVRRFPAPALAVAVRERDDLLQMAAKCVEGPGDREKLRSILRPYRLEELRAQRRRSKELDLRGGLTPHHLRILRGALQAPPGLHVGSIARERAAVVVPLCNVEGIPSVLFEMRASSLRSFPNQVCFPGGKIDDGDESEVAASLRELTEELGMSGDHVEVLGILRCDHSRLASLVGGVDITPVVGFVGNVTSEDLRPNPDEVSQCFSVPLRTLAEGEKWVLGRRGQDGAIFRGGPHVIWGLTGEILHSFLEELWSRYDVLYPDDDGELEEEEGEAWEAEAEEPREEGGSQRR